MPAASSVAMRSTSSSRVPISAQLVDERRDDQVAVAGVDAAQIVAVEAPVPVGRRRGGAAPLEQALHGVGLVGLQRVAERRVVGREVSRAIATWPIESFARSL